MKLTLHILLYSLFILAAGAADLGAADWYVDSRATGDGSGTSWQHAFRDFPAIRWDSGGVMPGDTLHISGGVSSTVYTSPLVVPIPGTSEARITIKVGQDAGHDGMVVIDGGYRHAVGVSLGPWVTLDGEVNGRIGLKVRYMNEKGISAPNRGDLPGVRIRYVELEKNGTREAGRTRPGYAHGIHLLHARDTEISYTHIHGSYKDGINLGESTGSWGSNRIHHNHIHDNGDDGITGHAGIDAYDNLIHDLTDWTAGHPDGIQILGNYTRIYNNIIYNCENAQIFWDSTENGGEAAHARIFNNLVYMTRPATTQYYRGIAVKAERMTTGLRDLVITNNTVVDMGYFGIGVAANGLRLTDVRIEDNIVYNTGINSSSAIILYNYNRFEDVRVDRNFVHAGSDGNRRIDFGSPLEQANEPTGVPVFFRYRAFAADNDFRLSAGSLSVGYRSDTVDSSPVPPGITVPGEPVLPAGDSPVPVEPGPTAPATPKGLRVLEK